MISTVKTGLVIAAALLFCVASQPVGAQEKKAKKAKVVGIEAVITDVGKRTITYQFERKGKRKAGVVGVDDDTTYIERISRDKISMKDLQKGDKVYLRYEDGSYEPALSVQVVGKEELKKKSKKKKGD